MLHPGHSGQAQAWESQRTCPLLQCQEAGTPSPMQDTGTLALNVVPQHVASEVNNGRFSVLKSLCMHGALKWPLLSVPRRAVE